MVQFPLVACICIFCSFGPDFQLFQCNAAKRERPLINLLCLKTCQRNKSKLCEAINVENSSFFYFYVMFIFDFYTRDMCFFSERKKSKVRKRNVKNFSFLFLFLRSICSFFEFRSFKQNPFKLGWIFT